MQGKQKTKKAKEPTKKQPTVTIIIKALNEEKNIERAIKSALKAIKNLGGEVILADSLSTDKTIKIASKYPIRIVQLTNPEDRSCGVGPQLGYQHSRGKYIYILDGDMELEPGFLEEAIKLMEEEKNLAGVGGLIKEMRALNIVFKRRKKKERIKEKTYLDRLEMGGLYSRKAINSVGYFSNRNLHAYEEAELGFRLRNKGWKLCRIPVPAIKHYGYTTNTFGVFKKRWRTKYVKGSGELLRASLGKKYFFKTAWHLKIYLGVIAWWAATITTIITGTIINKEILKLLIPLIMIALLIMIILIIKKKSIKEALFSITSWHYSATGLIWGFFTPQKNPKERISSKIIK